MSGAGRLLIALGACLLLIGIVMVVWGRQLPGDLVFRRGNLTVYFPLGLSILLSVVLTLLLNLLFRGR
jgi:hypothetical protein